MFGSTLCCWIRLLEGAPRRPCTPGMRSLSVTLNAMAIPTAAPMAAPGSVGSTGPRVRHGAGLALVEAVALVERSEDLAVGAQVEAGNSKSSPADKARRRQRDRLIEDGH